MKSSGFSLLELSIVLVIIGLIAGGIVAGASMIRAAELRSIITDVERYKTSVFTFRDKYLAIPGDIRNAHSFWDDGADGVCGTAAECNGNGNGRVDNTAIPQENFRFWQHLSLAGLVEGSFTGTGADGTFTGNCVGGLNMPEASVGGTGFIVSPPPSPPFGFPDDPVIFQYGSGFDIFHAGCLDNPALTPQEGWNLDKKMDDGVSVTGSMHTIDGAGGTCLVNQGTDNSFNLTNDAPACRFFIK